MSLSPDFRTRPATEAEVRAAYEEGKTAGADFVILSRETEEDGTVDEQTLLVFAPEGNPLRKTFAQMAEKRLAIRVSPLTRRERQKQKKRGGQA